MHSVNSDQFVSGSETPIMFSSQFKERSVLVAGIGMVMLNRLALRARLRRRVDGWRRAAGLVLRGEAATFVLSAFGLDVWSDAVKPSSPDVGATQRHLAHRLDGFLAGEPDSHVYVRRGAAEDRAAVGNGPSYTLGFEPKVDGPQRFVRPDHWHGADCCPRPRDQAADALLNVVCRVSQQGSADVWVRVNHVGADGVPLQEMLTRLEIAWGVAEPVLYPTPQAFEPYSIPRRCAGRPELAEVHAFIDFGPLLNWRNRENVRLAEPITVSAAMLWCLARHEDLAGLRMGTTVEVRAIDGLRRGVGVVAVRPADYFKRQDGLARYVKDFNRQMKLTRMRSSVGCQTLDAAALIPRGLSKALLRHALQQRTGPFGSLGLTILKDARVFGAPIGDVGHADGFIAIGSVALPTEGGGSAGSVAIKGPAARIAAYPKVLQEAIGRVASY